jgi:hypothetical protein
MNSSHLGIFASQSGIYDAAQFVLITVTIILGVVARNLPFVVGTVGTVVFAILVCCRWIWVYRNI